MNFQLPKIPAILGIVMLILLYVAYQYVAEGKQDSMKKTAGGLERKLKDLFRWIERQ